MGSGNRIKESVASAPLTANISLGNPTDPIFTAFSNHYAENDQVEYWAEDGNNWEHGYGSYSVAGNTISRDTIIETMVTGTYDDTPAGPISLGANTIVMVTPTQEMLDNIKDAKIDGYTEKAEHDTLAPVAGTLTIPLDGRRHYVTLGENVTLATLSVADAGYVGSAVVDLVQDATGFRTVQYPASWFWPNGVDVTVDPTALARTRITLSETSGGDIDAEASVREPVP